MDFFWGIIGCGGHARSMADVIISNKDCGNLIFFDDNAKYGEKIIGNYEAMRLSTNIELLKKSDAIFLGIGDNRERAKMKKYLDGYGVDLKSFHSLIAQNSEIGTDSKISKHGTYVAKRGVIGPESQIGDFCIINTGAVVEHECIIGNYSHISVNATVCGRCKIGNNVFVGAGAVIKDNVSICDDVVVGAGSVVIHDIVKPGVYVGTPVMMLPEKNKRNDDDK